MSESQKYYKSERSPTKEYVLYDSIYKISKCKLFHDQIWSVVAVDG